VARLGRRAAACPGPLLENTPPSGVGCRALFNKLPRDDAGTGRQSLSHFCGCSSVGRARPRQGRGHEFETRHPLHVGCVRAKARVRRRACAWPRSGPRAASGLVHRATRVWAQPTWIAMSRSSRGQGPRAFNSATRVRFPYEIPRPPGTGALGDLAPRGRKSAAMIGRHRTSHRTLHGV
jgi:hypothetical protein